MNRNYLCCYDFETSGVDPHTCSMFQLAAKIIHPRKLEFIQGDEFKSFSRPPEFETLKDEAFEYQAKVRGISVAEMKQIIADAPPEKEVWKNFVTFTGRYHQDGCKRKSMFSAIIRAGINIRSYDNVIWQRLCEKYGYINKNGEQNIAFPRDNVDLMDICFLWFENSHQPEKYNMDCLREYFGLPSDGGHDAMFDVNQTGELIMRFLRLHRATNVKFRGALANQSGTLS